MDTPRLAPHDPVAPGTQVTPVLPDPSDRAGRSDLAGLGWSTVPDAARGVVLDRRVLIGAVALAGLGTAPAAATATPLLGQVRSSLGSAAPGITRAGLDAVITSALGPVSGSVGVTVIDRRTNVWHSHKGYLEFEMASTAKVLIMVALLRRRRADRAPVTSSDKRRIEAMIRWSDNAAATSLWRSAGGRAGLSETARIVGMPVTARSMAGTSLWGKARTTSDEQAKLLSVLAAGGRGLLHRDDCAYVLAEMRRVTSSQAWGAGIVRSRSVSVAVKNGWAPLSPDYRWRVNTVGAVRGDGRDYVIACYERNLSSMTRGVNRKNAVARAVHAALVRPLRVS